MGYPPPWYSGLVNYQLNFYRCGNLSWSVNQNAFCYENAAIRIAMYGKSSSWIDNLSCCQFKQTESSTPQNVDNGVSYNMNLYLATSEYNHHDMVAKFPEGVDPSNPNSISQMTLFQYGNFNITPGVADPNSTFVQLLKGNLTLYPPTNTLVIYRVNDIHLEVPDSHSGTLTTCAQGGGVLRFNKTPIQAYSIDSNGNYSLTTIPSE
jgi:hypothetical protein